VWTPRTAVNTSSACEVVVRPRSVCGGQRNSTQQREVKLPISVLAASCSASSVHRRANNPAHRGPRSRQTAQPQSVHGSQQLVEQASRSIYIYEYDRSNMLRPNENAIEWAVVVDTSNIGLLPVAYLFVNFAARLSIYLSGICLTKSRKNFEASGKIPQDTCNWRSNIMRSEGWRTKGNGRGFCWCTRRPKQPHDIVLDYDRSPPTRLVSMTFKLRCF